MTDEQLHRRMISTRLLIVAVVLLLAAAGLLYYRSYRQPELESYRALKAQEDGLRNQVTQMQSDVASRQASIEQNGQQLVSFTEDRNVFVTRASELAQTCGVGMPQLSVSSVWNEGSMSGMTVRVEVEGGIEGIRNFLAAYCDPTYTNRITHVSCRPTDDYPWIQRYIDELDVLEWFDLTEEESKYENEAAEQHRQQQQEILASGGSVETSNQDAERSITLDDMFKAYNFKLYIEVDFLGRQ